MAPTFVVVGAGLAGGAAAGTLRELGFDGRIVVLGEEEDPPYERPPLSKQYLRGEQPLSYLYPRAWYEEQDVDLRTGRRVTRIEPAAREVVLSDDERIRFDRALIATGARNRRLPIPGLDLTGVMDLRTVGEADRIIEAASAGGRVALVGMGFIGAEVAASLRHLRVEVTVIEIFETALYRVLGPEIGRVVEAFHRDHGVDMRFGESVDRFEGDGLVEAVVTKSGQRIECDFAVVGIGVQPNVEAVSGIAAENGIPVDATLQTDVPGVFAAGDVAVHEHPVFGRIRVEHYDNALKMGAAAARNMLEAGEVFDDPHWFWSDQYDMELQMAGVALSWDQLVVRGSMEDRSFTGFYLSNGVLRSVVSVNRGRDVRRSMPLIRAAIRPDPAALRDEDVDLRSLLPA